MAYQQHDEQRYQCALCGRDVRFVTKHHLIPKSKGGREVVNLCAACHKTLHSFFTNETLLKELHDLDALRRNPEIAHYLKWVRGQPDHAIRVHASRTRY